MRQYVSALAREGIQLDEFVAPAGSYPPAARWLRPLWAGAALAASVPRVARSWAYDASLLQREILSTLVTIEGMTRRPRILDVDDAIFLYREGRTARRLARLCDRVICGNAFLAEWFRRWNRDVAVVPTAVDTNVLVPPTARPAARASVIGWIGTSGNLKYLASIEPALRRVLEEVEAARLCVVSDRPPALPSLPADRVHFERWSEAREPSLIQDMDVGLMPLEDSPWARGKCSFKMLQYMACGVPVVVSPVGMNAEVLALGRCGFGATTLDEWCDALVALLRSSTLRATLGAEGRRITEASFSVAAVAPRLAQCLRT